MTAILDDDLTPDEAVSPVAPPPNVHDSMAAARLAGYSWDEIDGHLDNATDQALAAGYSQDEINAHLGYDGHNTLAANLTQARPAEPTPPAAEGGEPAPLDQPVKDLYAEAVKDKTAKDHFDFSGALGGAWNLDPQTQGDIASQLPDPRHLLDLGIEAAHLTGKNILDTAVAARDNLLNLWTNLTAGTEDDQASLRKQYLSNPLLADAVGQPGGVASATDAKNQEEAEKLQPTLQDLTQDAGRDALKHAVTPLPYLWADPETIVDMAKGIYNLPATALSFWDQVEKDRVAGKDVSEAWKDSPAFNMVAQALMLKGAHTAGALLKEAGGAVPGVLKDEAGSVPREPPKPGEEAKPPKGTEPAPPFDLHPDHVAPEVLDTMRAPDGTLDANKIAMSMGEQVKGKPAPEAKPAKAEKPTPPAEGMTRFYHGWKDENEPTSGGGRWVTTDPQYAEDFRRGAEPNRVSYVDVPKGHPEEVAARNWEPADEANGINNVGTYHTFETSEDLAKQMKPFNEQAHRAAEPTQIDVNGKTITRQPEESVEDFAQRAHAVHTKDEVDGAVSELANPKPAEAPPPVLKPPGLEGENTNVTSWVRDLDRQILQLSSNARAGEAAAFRMFKAQPKEWLDPAFQSKVRKSVELKLGADDPSSVTHPPDVQAFLDAHKSLTDHQYANAVEQARLLEGQPELQPKGLRTVDQGHVHRIVVGEENLGHELDPETNRDPITGVRPSSRSLSKWDPGMQSRADMYVYEDAKGNRNWGKERLADQGLKMGDVVEDGTGHYKIKPARQDEIEANTPLRYRDNFLGQTVQDVMTSDRVNDNLRFIKTNVPRLQEAGLFVPEGSAGGKVPSGWVRVDVPQMRGYAPARIARPLNNFYQMSWERGDLLPGLVTANHWIISSLFMSPIGHMKNEAAHFFPSRGAQWVNPMGWARLAYYGNKASRAVYNMDENYERFLRANGALLGSATRTRNFNQIMWTKFLHEQMEDKGGAWSGVAKYSGFSSLKAMVAWQYRNSNKILWNGGDILRLTRMMELENADKIGIGGGKQRSVAEAVHETHKSMPPYQIGSEVLGSGKVAEAMKSPLFQIFGRYRHGQIASLYNDVRDAVGPARTLSERTEAAGRAVAFAGMYYGMAQVGMYAGGATLVHAAQSLFSGDKEWQNVIGSWFTSSPIIRALSLITSNLDHNGKEIWRKGGTTFGNLVSTAKTAVSQFPIGQNLLDLTKPGGAAKVGLKFLGADAAKPPADPAQQAKWDKRAAATAAAAERKDDLETFLRNFANEHLGTSIAAPAAGGSSGGGGGGGGGRAGYGGEAAAPRTRAPQAASGGGGSYSQPSQYADNSSGGQGFDPNGIVARGGARSSYSRVSRAGARAPSARSSRATTARAIAARARRR